MNGERTASTAGAGSNGSRALANRNNAAKSTGPRTAAGRAIVAKNGIGHGIYAHCPVIEGVESELDWKRYRKAMLASLAPEGMLEATLAERIILTAWRQLRAARFETEQIRLEQEDVFRQVGRKLLGYGRESAAIEVQELMKNVDVREGRLQDANVLIANTDDEILSKDKAVALLCLAWEHLRLGEGFNDYWTEFVEPEPWTLGIVRQLILKLAGDHGKPSTALFEKIAQKASDEYGKAWWAAKEAKEEIRDYRREHMLPNEGTLDKVVRYEAHLTRQFHRDLHELQRLQAMRNGLPVAAPAAIDVDVVSGTNGN